MQQTQASAQSQADLVELKIVVSVTDVDSTSGASSSSDADEASKRELTQHVSDLTGVVTSLRLRSEWLEEELQSRQTELDTLRTDAAAAAAAPASSGSSDSQDRIDLLSSRLASVEAANDVLTQTVANLREKELQVGSNTARIAEAKANEQMATQLKEIQQKYSVLLAELQTSLQHSEQNDAEYKTTIASLQKHYEHEMESMQSRLLQLELRRSEEHAAHADRVAQLAQQLHPKKVGPTDEEPVAKAAAAETTAATSDPDGAEADQTGMAAQFEALQKQAARLHRDVEHYSDANGKLDAEVRLLTARVEQQAAQIALLQSSAVTAAATHATAIAQAQTKQDELASKLAAAERDARSALLTQSNKHAGELDSLNASHASQIADLRTRLSRKEAELLDASSSSDAIDLASSREKTLSSKLTDLMRMHEVELADLKSAHATRIEQLAAKHATREEQLRANHADAIAELDAIHAKQLERVRKDAAIAQAELQSSHQLALASATSAQSHETSVHQLAIADLSLKHKQELSQQRLAYDSAVLDLSANLNMQLKKSQSELALLQQDMVDTTMRLTKMVNAKKELESVLGTLETEQLAKEKRISVQHERALHEAQIANNALQRQVEALNLRIDEQRATYDATLANARASQLAAEQAVVTLRQHMAQNHSDASIDTLMSARKLTEAESQLTSLRGQLQERDSKIAALDTKIADQALELHDLMRVRADRNKSERRAIAQAASHAESKGLPSIVREEDAVDLDSLSKGDLITRYRSLRFSYDAHLNHADELQHTLTLSFEKELQALQTKLHTQDKQYQVALTTLKENHSNEIASTIALHAKLKSEYELKEKKMYQDIQILESSLKKLSGSISMPNSPRGGVGAGGDDKISTAHSQLLTEYQSLFRAYTQLQATHAKVQAANEAFGAKLESAKKLVIALNNERKELIEYKQRKRKENEQLRSDCKRYYLAYMQASAAASAASLAPMSSPLGSPTSSVSAMSPMATHDSATSRALIDEAALLSPTMAKTMAQRDEEEKEPHTPAPHNRRMSLLTPATQAHAGGLNGSMAKGSSITLIPSSSHSSSGYALRMSTEIVVVRDLELDTLPFYHFDASLDSTSGVPDEQATLIDAIATEVSTLLADYGSWAKQIDKALHQQQQNANGTSDSPPRGSSSKTNLLSELLAECRRVDTSSLARQDSIIQLIAQTFHQAAKQRVEANGQVIPQRSIKEELLAHAPRKESQFVLQSDLQLVYVGKTSAEIKQGVQIQV